jgi:lysophospholipid acyltransferase (LPLAT)-like uncharacterized protein
VLPREERTNLPLVRCYASCGLFGRCPRIFDHLLLRFGQRRTCAVVWPPARGPAVCLLVGLFVILDLFKLDFPMQASAQRQFKGARSKQQTVERAYTFADLSAYPLKKRFLIKAADLSLFLLIHLIGRTIRFEVNGWEHWETASRDGLPIYAFWHNRVFLATYYFRQRGIVVMTSQSFDGEYIARFIQRFGYGTARGSSTRGGVGAIIEMARLMRAGFPAGFSIDGPKGPRYVAKMGAVLLAKKTGRPILPFTITASSFWCARKSWDQLQVPRPFARALVDIAAPIYVAPDADETELLAKRDELQRALDEITQRGNEWLHR